MAPDGGPSEQLAVTAPMGLTMDRRAAWTCVPGGVNVSSVAAPGNGGCRGVIFLASGASARLAGPVTWGSPARSPGLSASGYSRRPFESKSIRRTSTLVPRTNQQPGHSSSLKDKTRSIT